jgi:hypothetical protein
VPENLKKGSAFQKLISLNNVHPVEAVRAKRNYPSLHPMPTGMVHLLGLLPRIAAVEDLPEQVKDFRPCAGSENETAK